MNKKLLLIDGNSILYRAFYAIPSLETSKNIPTNGLLGFLNIFLNAISVYKPDYIAISFDTKARTFRKDIYEDYKSQRKELPSSLVLQLKILKDEILKPFSIKVIEKDGFEADDILATISKLSEKMKIKTLILTGDRDLLQLVKNDSIVVIAPIKGVSEITYYNEEKVIEEYGITPNKFTQYKALIGDASDNIKGVPGIGPKKAKTFLSNYDIDNLLSTNSGEGKKLREFKDLISSNLVLVELNRNVPIYLELEDLKFNGIDVRKLIEISKKFEFKSIIKRYSKKELEKGENFPPQKLEDFSILKNENIISIIPNSNSKVEIATKDASYSVNLEESVNLFDSYKDKILDLLKTTSLENVSYDLKSLLHLINAPLSFKPNKVWDAQIAYFLLKPNAKNYSIENFEIEYWNGSSKDSKGEIVLKCFNRLKEELLTRNELDLYENLEMPLLYVLYNMEKVGFKVSREKLIELKEKFDAEIESIKDNIYKEAKVEFNISSPKQLSFVLFEKLKLPTKKKSKSGSYSTGADVLEELYNVHKIIPLIIKYRELTKSLNTYVEPFLKLTENTSFIHTTFVQAGPATGRISSINPNLQNLPTGSEISEGIRKAFIPRDKKRIILSADYSQIDLRVLAHFSKDPTLIETFNKDGDIHTETAKLIFGVSEASSINTDMRRVAKTVNFGIIYGMSSYGLSQSLKISEKEASIFIEKYFENFYKVKDFIKEAIDKANRVGYSETILGRRRDIPELKSENKIVRQLGERLAVNSVIQGSSADIIKIAMIKVNERIKDSGAYLILQIHDELILDCPIDKIDTISSIIREEMENTKKPSSDEFELLLSVPVKVSLSYGESLGELKPVSA